MDEKTNFFWAQQVENLVWAHLQADRIYDV